MIFTHDSAVVAVARSDVTPLTPTTTTETPPVGGPFRGDRLDAHWGLWAAAA